MRTRFLTTDYFNSAPIETLDEFFRLPLPQLPPPPLSHSEQVDLLNCIDESDVSLQIDTLPVDRALSKFFSDVLPHTIHFDRSCSPKWSSDEKKAEVLYQDMELERLRNLASKTLEEETGSTIDGKGDKLFEILQFEMPELDISLENVCVAEKEEKQIFSEVSDAETIEDVLSPILGIQNLCKIQESIFAVENISMEYYLDQKVDLLEDIGSIKGQNHPYCSEFPLLEVDVSSLGIFSSISVETESLLLESIEPQQLRGEDEILVDGKELLQFMEFDILQYLSGHCSAYQCLDAEISCSNFVQEMELFSIIELSADDYSGWSMNPILFEEFQFVDLNSSHVFEPFCNQASLTEAETCQEMFSEASKFRNFNELIVIHELTLVDDSFKSLPVPILSHHGKIRSLMEYIEETLSELKPQPSFASDAIYLDWHILEDDNFSSGKYSACLNALEDLDICSADSGLNSFDGPTLVFDLIFSENSLNTQNTIENKETLNIPFGDFSVGHMHLNESNVLNDGCQKRLKGDVSCDIVNYEKVLPLDESMSKFDDLDFFLNPLKSAVRKSQHAEKVVATSTTFPGGSCNDSVKLHQVKLSYDILEDPQSVPVLSESNQKLEELLNFMPVVEYNVGPPEAIDTVKPCSIPLPAQCLPSDIVSTDMCTSTSSSPDAIIIVNTQSVDTEMIISRRSTYQRILAMEKQGTQVVERDLNLPVDVIVSPAVCLAWYDCRNIGKKTTAPNEASSSLPSCVENIAANVLTSLSFTFKGCILVFEGESSFLAGVMESSDELYAASASLGMDMQLFCSYSSEMTDEIILSCIGHATKSTKSLYPRMPESQTLAESFLTTFPSINPLSAHAILSSAGTLVEFLEWPHACRICAVQKYHVPDESVALLSAFCKYGEREDCKSGMTDCSSSVSSAPNSATKSVSEMRKRKHNGSPLKVDMAMDELCQFEPMKLFTEGRDTPTRTPKPYNYWLSKDPDMFDEVGKSNVSFEDKMFTLNQGSNINFKGTSSRMSKIHVTPEEMEYHSLPENDALFCRNQGPDNTATPITFKGRNNNNTSSGNLGKDFIGEVIDIDDSCPSVEHSNSLCFSHLVADMERDPGLGFSRTARKLSFGGNSSSLPIFPTAAQIRYDSRRHDRQNSGEKNFQHSDVGFSNEGMLLEHQKDLLKEDAFKTHKNSSSSLEKDKLRYGGTPLSKAVRSGQLRQGSPWTIEFLNRIREKSRLRQQSLPPDLSAPYLGYSGNTSKATKRKSPSILDFYKYQRGGTPNKVIEQKRQRHSLQPSCSAKNEKALPSSVAAMTPMDKRARQRLSFATSGSGGQSRLVWGDENAHTQSKQF